jgi:cation transport ATPase
MHKIIHFFKHYKQLGLVIVAIIISLGLELAKQPRWAHLILGLTAAVSVVPLLWGMIQDIRDGKYGVDILAATAIIASVALGGNSYCTNVNWWRGLRRLRRASGQDRS